MNSTAQIPKFKVGDTVVFIYRPELPPTMPDSWKQRDGRMYTVTDDSRYPWYKCAGHGELLTIGREYLEPAKPNIINEFYS